MRSAYYRNDSPHRNNIFRTLSTSTPITLLGPLIRAPFLQSFLAGIDTMKRIILAGGSGFLGRSLAPTLLGEGYEVVVLSRTRTGHQGNLRYVQWDAQTIGDWAD